MTDAERKTLEARRTLLINEREQAQVKIHQATGAIAMIDAMLNMPREAVQDPKAAEAA